MTTASVLPARYKINGLIDTGQNVMQNLTALATSAGTFIGYDVHEGKWSVIINRASSSVKSFNDTNIVGAMQVNGTGLDELYNSVTIEFPLRDTADAMDIIKISIPAGDRNPNEPDNDLQIRLDQVNEPVQAEIIGLIELKQARLDMIVTFDADYTAVSVNAGDVIDITNTVYGWTGKLFRVITMEEIDDEVGNLYFRLTCLEYDANVYDTSDIGRYIRQDSTGIKAIGAIGTPAVPTIYNFTYDQRPGLLLEAVAPTGVVENIEFWLSTNGTDYTLIGTVPPEGGGTFSSGDSITLDYDQVDNANYYVKVRGMNSTTTGPFSTAAVLSAFTPVQITGAIGPNSDVVNSSNQSLLGLLGSNVLIALIKQLMEDGNVAPGNTSIFGQVFGLLNNETGINLPTALGNTIIQGSSTVQTRTKQQTVNILNAQTANYTTNNGYDLQNIDNNAFTNFGITSQPTPLLTITVSMPLCTFDYEYLDPIANAVTTAVTFAAQPPVEIILYRDGTDLDDIIAQATQDWQINNTRFSIPNAPAGNYIVKAAATPTYILNQDWDSRTGVGNGFFASQAIFPTDFSVVGNASTAGYTVTYTRQ